MGSILNTDNLVKRFGGLAAVDKVTLDVEEESIVGLIGPNGSGKTTLFNVLTGIYRPDAGKVFFRRERIDGLQPHQVYVKGLVRTFQTPKIIQKMTVLDNVMLAVKNPGESLIAALFKRRSWIGFENRLREKALEILRFLGLDKHAYTPASELSGGQMKLLEIARALISEPKMMLLDEPTAGVNPVLAYTIFDRVKELRKRFGITFFIIEHRIELLMRYVDRVYVMHQGKLIAEGEPNDIMNNPDVVKVYLGSI